MKPKSNSISGGCLCGEVEFTFTLPIKWCANCHCTRFERSDSKGCKTLISQDFIHQKHHIQDIQDIILIHITCTNIAAITQNTVYKGDYI